MDFREAFNKEQWERVFREKPAPKKVSEIKTVRETTNEDYLMAYGIITHCKFMTYLEFLFTDKEKFARITEQIHQMYAHKVVQLLDYKYCTIINGRTGVDIVRIIHGMECKHNKLPQWVWDALKLSKKVKDPLSIFDEKTISKWCDDNDCDLSDLRHELDWSAEQIIHDLKMIENEMKSTKRRTRY